MQAIALNTEPARSIEWCLDSGATRHMCNDCSKFSTFTKSKACNVYTAAEHQVKSEGAGNVKLKITIPGNISNGVRLQDTMLVPEFRNNLMSVSRMTDNNYVVIFRKNGAMVKRSDGSIAMTARR